MFNKLKAIFVVLSCLIVSLAYGDSAPSGLTKSRLKAAAETYEAGQYAEALNLISSAVRDLEQRAPMRLEKCLIVTEPASGFGAYHARNGSEFLRGETIYFYFEPKGGVLLEEGGFYKGGIVVDLRVSDSKGEVVFQKERTEALSYQSRSYMNDIFINFAFSLKEADAGKYRIDLRVRDKNSRKIAYANQEVVLK